MMTNAIIGLVIVLCAWLIVNTIFKYIVTGNLSANWNQIQCIDNPGRTADRGGTVTGGAVTSGGAGGGAGASGGTVAGGTLSDAATRELLASNGITINKTAAQGTNLEGMRSTTVQDIIDLKNDCNCTVVVTGGTENTGGHAAGPNGHTAGYKYDARPNPQLDQYITSNYTNIGTRSDGATMYKSPDGSIYAREGDHWDVLVKG